MIEIVEYKRQWPEEFQLLADKVRQRVGASILGLHHIGSTAVPGMDAKDVIDIQISVEDLSLDAEKGLELAGFERVPNLVDHCPFGMTLPDEQLSKRFYRGVTRAANVHVRQIGRVNHRYPLLCRDFLRHHKGAASAYAEMKRQLAKRFPNDVDSYYAIKDPAFDLIMSGAEEWAISSDWSIPDYD
ncbi:GrpB family protein [Ruegeria sp. EL01]|jgi:GrpB-like predicted nucleotidyltransferase (UPF0157 family)|uniref:GrpB family protein n=1 Tax=Ruegeria sp. EL01 TaxID=2107578 RepID=UPI000EA82C4C|nr:GrpB family protein [Ruegeria sp. EL01]